ncbi:hypothetical protein CF319_g9199, partial [Tilletia indica]
MNTRDNSSGHNLIITYSHQQLKTAVRSLTWSSPKVQSEQHFCAADLRISSNALTGGTRFEITIAQRRMFELNEEPAADLKDLDGSGFVSLQKLKKPSVSVILTTNLEAAHNVVHLDHVTKPWTREAWERARPWILEQRQKLESNGWVPTDANRTELYVLKRNAPAGAFTEDGSLYLRIPKKFVDFMRSGRDEADKKRRVTKKKDVSYKLDSEWVWK